MSAVPEWSNAYLRQADADYKAWRLHALDIDNALPACHQLFFLQMCCEKLCKSFLLLNGTPLESIQSSHAYVAKTLPALIAQELRLMKSTRKRAGLLVSIRHIAQEIELLSPAVHRDGRRPDNCEYPWNVAGGAIRSPLDHAFSLTGLCRTVQGQLFVKLLRRAIQRRLAEK